MSAAGELYVDEDCRDSFIKELNDWFGVENWLLSGSKFGDYYDMATFPNIIKVDVMDENAEVVIGEVEITSKPYIEECSMSNERWVEMNPVSIKLISRVEVHASEEKE